MRVHHKAGHNGRTGVRAVQHVAKIRQECVSVNAWAVSMPKQCALVSLLNIKLVRFQRVRNGSNGVNGTLALFRVVMEHVGDNENVPKQERTSVLDRPPKPKSVLQDHVVADGITGQNGVNVRFHVVLVFKQDLEIAWAAKSEEEIVSVLQRRKSEYFGQKLSLGILKLNSHSFNMQT